MESVSYGLTCCAERIALFKALTEGKKSFRAIAVVAGLTAASGLWVAADLRGGEGRAHETRPVMHGEQLVAGSSGLDSRSPLDG